jgi:type III polyketide synthase
VPQTESDLGFDVDPLGWKVVLSPRVPQLTQSVLAPTFTSLLASLPPLPAAYADPADFDWAMHPGGATILTGAEKALGLSPEHMRASYDTYMNHGNSSSATILSVLDRLRRKDMDALAPRSGNGGGGPKDYVVGCAFGPGITVEMCMLKRNLMGGGGGAGTLRGGMETPPETESEGGGGSDVDERSEQGEVSVEGAERGRLDTKMGEDGEAFISEALEGVELD